MHDMHVMQTLLIPSEHLMSGIIIAASAQKEQMRRDANGNVRHPPPVDLIFFSVLRLAPHSLSLMRRERESEREREKDRNDRLSLSYIFSRGSERSPSSSNECGRVSLRREEE